MKKILTAIAVFVIGVVSPVAPVMATNQLTSFGETQASILKDCASKSDGKKGEGITCILELVVDIMSIGIGILGVVGISIVGTQYLTAGGNEEKTRKAKRRLIEIIIGIALYAVMYLLLKFLLPGFNGIGSGS